VRKLAVIDTAQRAGLALDVIVQERQEVDPAQPPVLNPQRGY
jgi:hypothetical protein